MSRSHLYTLLVSLLWVGITLYAEEVHAESEEREQRVLVLNAETGRAIPDVICSVWGEGHRRRAFAQTDKQGIVTLHLRPEDQSVSFSLLGFAKLECPTANLVGTPATLRLHPTEVQLREVHIQAQPITTRGDTLRYHVKTFAGRQDRYLEDILKKLPGVRILENGRIEYQGKAINKFYIEGQDPLGMNYNQASRNLPTEAVDQVEVIEHNQHKRILQGRVVSDQPAINIRLNDRYRFRPFGEVGAGTGVRPPLWTGRAYLMQFARTNQLITTARANNTGDALATDFAEHPDPLLESSFLPKPATLLSVSSGHTPPLGEQRYLGNKALTWGVNDLQRVGAYGSLRLNVLGYHDRQRARSTQSMLYQGAQPLQLDETSTLGTRPDYYNAALRYELNAPKHFLNWELRFGSRQVSYAEELSSGSRHYALQLRQRPQWLQSQLQTQLFLGEMLVSISSTLRGYTAGEQLTGETSSPTEPTITEHRRVSQLLTSNEASANFAWGDFRLSTGLTARADLQSFGREALAPQRDDSYQLLRVGLSSSLSYQGSLGNITLSSPITYGHEDLRIGRVRRSEGRLWAEPSLSFYKRLAQGRLSVFARAGYSYSPETDTYYAPERIRRSYRGYYQSVGDLYHREGLSLMARLGVRNPVEMLFAYLSVMHRTTTRDFYRDIRYQPEATITLPVDSTHTGASTSTQLSIDKAFARIGLSLRTDLGYMLSSQLSSLLGRAYRVRSEDLIARQSLSWTKLASLELSGAVGFGCLWIYQPFAATRPIPRLESELRGKWSPTKTLGVALVAQHTMTEVQARQYKHSIFCDLEASWDVSKRIKLDARLSNIWDETYYTVTTITATELTRLSVPLRGRELLLRCTLRL